MIGDGRRWRSSPPVTWQPRPVLVVYSKRGRGGLCTGYSPWLWAAVIDDGRWSSLAAMAIGGGVVVGEKEVTRHDCYRLPDLGRRGPPDRKVGISSISSC